MMFENLQSHQITLLFITSIILLIFLILLIFPIFYYIKRKFDFLKLLLKNRYSSYQDILNEYDKINSSKVGDKTKKKFIEILKILLHCK